MYNTHPQRIVATVEARMTSSRLPGKVLLPILGIPALELLVKRLKRSRYLDGICIATTNNATDDPIVALAERLGVSVFRGSETDVLGRVLGAAESVAADLIVEITGDCPFVDPALVDRGITEFFSGEYDYAVNTLEASYANGFDVQVFPTRVLSEVATLTDDPIDRTHVSYYIYMHPEHYRLKSWVAPPECFGPEQRMTLDEDSDYQALTVVAEALATDFPDQTWDAPAVTTYLRAHPEVVAINAGVRQKDAHEL